MANKNFWDKPMDGYCTWWVKTFMGHSNITRGEYAKTCITVNLLVLGGMVYGVVYAKDISEMAEDAVDRVTDFIDKMKNKKK